MHNSKYVNNNNINNNNNNNKGNYNNSNNNNEKEFSESIFKYKLIYENINKYNKIQSLVNRIYNDTFYNEISYFLMIKFIDSIKEENTINLSRDLY